jgi:hypothetical protein
VCACGKISGRSLPDPIERDFDLQRLHIIKKSSVSATPLCPRMAEYVTASVTYSVLPPLLTTYLQKFLYSSSILPVQHAQSPQFHRDRKFIYTALVVAYLLYTTFAAFAELHPTYYDLLGVATTADATGIRSRFKILYVPHFARKLMEGQGHYIQTRARHREPSSSSDMPTKPSSIPSREEHTMSLDR